MAATVTPPPDSGIPAPPDARVSLKAPSPHPGMVNGAWWPRSRDLTRELPSLIAALDKAWGKVDRATVNVNMWPDIPRRVRTGTHVVRVGWFDAEQDPHDICLLSYRRGGRWDLLVVPPELDADTAARLMATAAEAGNMQTATALLSAASTCEPESADAGRAPDRQPDDGREPAVAAAVSAL
ncbi:hypothetical protein KGA66_17495 [Actinocrinis puniceicyclus]|uniref:Uncharacterized protein n=1 Tax=Actinocrinis puniceicyclus TaxID=977794 RepID=A0A8J7WLZ6_9ACTN|nr:DUF5994 family protein [Actinocrinis puniceicyclus]MBS2964856.1 hypothetical protein [Actinocrinis puniceicyclus]